jgi:type I restriction enzyme S subunit
MSDLVPEGWSKSRLDQFAVLQRGFDLPVQDRMEGKHPIYGSNGVTGYHNKSKVKSPGIVTGRSGSIGDVWFIENDFWALNTSLYIKNFYNNAPKYVYYFLDYFDLSRFKTGTGVPTLNRNDVHLVPIVYPPLPEQQKIAAILSSVDEVIEKTQAQINKLKDLKTGMMQELLSPREGQAATINNPQGESKNSLHHTEFKDSPLGRIPVGWEVVDANSVCSKITKGTTPPKSEYTNDNKIPFLRVNNLYFDNKIHFEKGVLFLSRSIQDGFLARSIVYPEDILMNIVGPPLSKIAIVPNDYSEYNVNQAIVIYRTVKKKIHNRYFMHYLTSNKAQNWLKTRSKKTSGQQNLTIELCKDLPVPLPSIDKQVQITNVLDGIDSLLTKKQERHSQLNNIKKALMQDLLTGKVRVKVDAA